MAGAGYKLFNTGDVLTAAQVNTYLQEQAVMRFANAAARTTALSGVLAEGMVSYLMDTNAVEVYDGSAWVGIATGDITAVTAGTGISGGGTSGAVTITNSMATEITAAGDIIVGTGSGTFDNLPIGTTGQVLTADTTVSPYKVKWATASGGGGITLIETKTLNNTASTYTFSSIAGTYKHLLVTGQGVTSGTGSASADSYNVQFNSVTSGSYSYVLTRVIGGSVSSTYSSGATSINGGYAIGHSTATSIDYAEWAMYVYDYASNDSYKSIQTSGGHTSRNDYSAGMGHFNSTNTITSITIASSYASNFTNGKLKLWGLS